MTRLFYIFILILQIYFIDARCLGDFVVWPTSDKININTIFVFEDATGFNKHLFTLKSTIISDGLFLKGYKTKVELEIIATYTNDFGFEQVVLKPKSLLKPYTKYKLVTRDGKPFMISNPNKKSGGKPIWFTNGYLDESQPIFKENVSISDESIGLTEGGQESYMLKFTYKQKDKSSCAIKITIINKETFGIKELICIPYKKEIYLGMNECYFGYDFKRKEDYELMFELIDSSGNTTKMAGDNLAFKRQK